MAEVAVYVELCTRLSRFVQLQPSSAHCKELQEVLDELVALYERVDVPEKRAAHTPMVGFAAMDDLVLLSLHKLLSSFVLNASSVALQERAFRAFASVLRRCAPPAELRAKLCFYLPPPPEADDDNEEVPGSLTLASQPEELRLAILKSLLELLEDEGQERQAMLLQVDQQHFFAYLVASLLHVARRERCREAALQAIQHWIFASVMNICQKMEQ
ncbi:hypothetical protein PInf_012844 [Phytophthora infestans]|nr:hypothetical protein PInf_012844 [Phytophthora infestans]